ncbi:hypothetical protein JZ751_024370, partial [Albula glossodonta]
AGGVSTLSAQILGWWGVKEGGGESERGLLWGLEHPENPPTGDPPAACATLQREREGAVERRRQRGPRLRCLQLRLRIGPPPSAPFRFRAHGLTAACAAGLTAVKP